MVACIEPRAQPGHVWRELDIRDPAGGEAELATPAVDALAQGSMGVQYVISLQEP